MSVTVRPDALTLPPLSSAIGAVDLPGSKSISNRALLLAALAEGVTELRGLLDADDVTHMREALAALGIVVASGTEPRGVLVHGGNGSFPNRRARLDLGNAGTAVRPLTAALAIHGGNYEIRGVARMHERPIADLVDPLVALGCDVRYLANPGYPPLAIGESRAHAGAVVSVRGDVSSQYTSALLMALPIAAGSDRSATTIEVSTPLVSRPYVLITTRLMQRFGVSVEMPDDTTFVVPAGARYTSAGTLDVEGDASAASYFLAAGVLGGGAGARAGVGRDSIQGDVAFADVLRRRGADIRYGRTGSKRGAAAVSTAGRSIAPRSRMRR